MILLW